ncbi:MAG: hypothetical protein ACWA5P_01680 [bacterium]
MKKGILKTILGYALVFVAIYFVGCFIQASFNIANWDINFKIALMFIWALLGTVVQSPIHEK